LKQSHSMRTNRRVIAIISRNYVVIRQQPPLRRTVFSEATGAVPFYNCFARMQWRREPMHGPQVAAAANVLFD
jgi:hypothetical protein